MAYCILKSYKLRIAPSAIFEALKDEKNCFFLDSSLNSNDALGRYSFLGIEPFYILETKNQDPFLKLREHLAKYKIASRKKMPPFVGGAVGYLSYDLGFVLEKKIKHQEKTCLEIPDCFLGFYNSAIIFDHLKGLLYICALGFPEKNSLAAKSLAESNFKKISSLISNAASQAKRQRHDIKSNRAKLNSSLSRQDYLLAVKKAKEYIRQGDIYQVNLSQQFHAKTGLSAFQIYRRLRSISPAYFSAYFDCGDFQILSSSPERFLRLESDLVITRPMKGTRPRAKSQRQDQRLQRELLESTKDKAELVMIVDLERNDLGRVCDYGSVKVDCLRQLEKYSTVFQTTATVSGRLHEGRDRIDLLRASFPGGSITGCPKIRAMEIIEELEPVRRSIYTGSLGYLSFSGELDFNIMIRTILKKKDNLYFGAGGGIVADSEPEKEYEEALVKARAMIEAIS